MDALVRCPRCWKRVPETARFCRRCGCSLHSVARQVPPQSGPDAPPAVGGGGIAALLSFVFMACLSIIGIALFSVATRPTRYVPPAPAPTYFENGPADAPSAPPAVEHGRHHPWLHRWNDPPAYRHTWDAPGVDRYPTRTDPP